MLPPALVSPRRDNAPDELRESRVEVVGSNVTEVVLSNRSRPAKAPARPTLPMRLKSTRGNEAKATLWDKRMAEVRTRREQERRLDAIVENADSHSIHGWTEDCDV